MAQHLRALLLLNAALAEDLGSEPPVTLVQGMGCSFLNSVDTRHACDTHTSKTLTHEIK